MLVFFVLILISPLFIFIVFLFRGDFHDAVRFFNIFTGRTVIRFSWPFVRVRVREKKNMKGIGPCILVYNHTSTMDIAFSTLTPPFNRIVFAKQWVFSLPVVGFYMKKAQYINVENLPENWHDFNKDILKRRNVSFHLYPEGTRSTDGSVGRFHSGAFHLSEEFNLPLVPVYMKGLGSYFSKKFPFFRPVKAEIRILPAVDPGAFPGDKGPLEMKKHVKKLYTDLSAE